MNFKESYKRDNEKIVPDAEYRDNLEKKIEMALSEESKRRKNISVTFKILSSCAAALVLVIAVTIGVRNSQNNNQDSIINHAGAGKQTSSSATIFSQSSWYDSEMSYSQIYELFIRRMSDSSDLTYLYMNNNNTFDDENLFDNTETEKLIKEIYSASVTDKTEKELDNAVYYMAQFKNGDIIKFIIYDNTYVKIKNIDCVFKK